MKNLFSLIKTIIWLIFLIIIFKNEILDFFIVLDYSKVYDIVKFEITFIFFFFLFFFRKKKFSLLNFYFFLLVLGLFFFILIIHMRHFF